MIRFYPYLSLVTIVLMFFLLGALSDERKGTVVLMFFLLGALSDERAGL
jgi:hypothetical protein